jgi:hypothetical protein
MKIEQKHWTIGEGWKTLTKELLPAAPQLVLVFGASALVKEQKTFDDVHAQYPQSHVVMMSTGGEICDTSVSDGTLSLAALYFEKTTLQFAQATISAMTDTQAIGERLAESLPKEHLTHVLVFSDGLKVNGTALVEGITAHLPVAVALTGGLVGDGGDFKHTYVGLDAVPSEGNIILIGLYGDALKVSYASKGGWDPFGPERTITKSKDNILYEVDGKLALDLYKEYLGEEAAKKLPGSGLQFPLELTLINKDGSTSHVTRSFLSLTGADNGIVFAGTMPEGVKAKLMKANFDRLVSGAQDAATMIKGTNIHMQFALLISCIGRKVVLKDRIEEETEAIREVFGPGIALAGFYSYGEISPVTPTKNQCELHNQTMTITTFAET